MRASVRSALLSLVLATVLAAAACGGGRETIRIGVLSDCLGYFGSYNEITLAAVELPLLERGAKLSGKKPSDGVRAATVGGKNVELFVGCSETAFLRPLIEQTRLLVEEQHADVVIGPTWGLTDGLVLRELARRYPEVAFVLGDSLAQETTLENSAPNVFRFVPDAAQATAGLGTYAYRELGWRTAAIVSEDWSFAWPQAAGFVAEFCALGGRVVDRLWATPPGDLGALAAQVPEGVDGVALMGPLFADPLPFARAYARLHPGLARQLVFAPGVVTDPAVLARGGRLLVGVATSSGAPPQSTGKWLRFRREYAKRFPGLKPPGSPDESPLILAYSNAMEATLEALEQTGGDLSGGGRKLMAALAGLELDTPTGKIRLDGNRQAIAPAYVSRVELGPAGKPVLRLLRVLPDVEQTFGGYFRPGDPPPSRESPACRRGTPPPWAR